MPVMSSRLPSRPSCSVSFKCAIGAPDNLLIKPALSIDHKPATCSASNWFRSFDRSDSKNSSSGPENSGATSSSVLATWPRRSDSGKTKTSTGSVPPALVWQRVMPCTGFSAISAWLMSIDPLLGLPKHSKSSTPTVSKSSAAKPVTSVKRGLTDSTVCASPSSSMLFSADMAMVSAAAGWCGISNSALKARASDPSSMRSPREKPRGLLSTKHNMPVAGPPGRITSGAPA